MLGMGKVQRLRNAWCEIFVCKISELKFCSSWALILDDILKTIAFQIPINPEDDPIILNAKCKTAEILGLKVIKLEEDFNTVQVRLFSFWT